MTATATPISAAPEQDHQHNDNQDQFHGISPLMATASCAAYQAFNGVFEGLFLTGVHPPLHCRVTGKFAPSQPDSGAPHLITERLFVQVVESKGRLEKGGFPQ
jgi:hypothetical protein